MTHRWNVITYDVLGNETDGYEVNDSHCVGYIELEEEDQYDDAIIVQKLVESEYLDPVVEVDELTFDGDEGIVYINEADSGYPLFCIQRDQRW